jgi:hypothetical protein
LTWSTANGQFEAAAPAGTGDMLAATYDPTTVAGDAFDADNHVYNNTTSGLTATDTQAAIDEVEGRVDTNDAKVTNATHTGDVTGSEALSIDKTAITGKTTVTGVSGDFVLITDTSDSDNLKKVNLSDLLVAGNLPVVDTTSIAEGSADATKEVRFEVDGLTTGNVRVITMADQNIDLTPGTGSFATEAEGGLAATALQDIISDTTPQLGGDLDTNGAQVQLTKGADIASAAALPVITDGNHFDVTGTTTVTSFDAVAVGTTITLQFDGVLTLTHNATDLILPTAANITTAVGDRAQFTEVAAGDWRCDWYTRADGTALASGTPLTSIVIGAAAFAPATLAAAPAAGSFANGNNYVVDYWSFDDTTPEYVFYTFSMPDNYDPALDIVFEVFWNSTATTNDVVWSVELSNAGPGEVYPTSNNVIVGAADAANGTAESHNVYTTTAVNPTDDADLTDVWVMGVLRSANSGNDDMTGDSRLIQVKMKYNQ